MENIEFIVFDKSRKWRAYRDIYQALNKRSFDILLHMQMSLRASLASLLVKAPLKLGFDRKRAHDLQWLFCNYHIPYQPKQHVIDSFFGFLQTLGIQQRFLEWHIPVSQEQQQWAQKQLKSDKPWLCIAPCSSQSYRNWTVAGYQQIARYALQQGMNVLLVGGNRTIEQDYANKIQQYCHHQCLDLTGKTSLKQLVALLQQVKVILSPDSGPAHLGTACGKPVIGLYACTNPDRARPYLSADTVINQYPQAVRDKYHKNIDELPWGIRVRDAGTMERITVDMVKQQLDKFI